MKTSWKIILITLVVGVPAFFLGPVIWSPSPEIHPTQSQIPYLIVLSAIEALAFGFGIAFIYYGLPLIRGIANVEKKAAIPMYVSLAWILISWWPHDNLHIHNALNVDGLIAIDYSFHFTVIAAGLILAYSFFAIFKPAAKRVTLSEECPAGESYCRPSPANP